MREPNRYASLNAEHEAARTAAAEPSGPETPAPYVPSLEEEIEARLATYEFTQGQRVEKGTLSNTDFFHGLRQLDHELALEIQQQPEPSRNPPPSTPGPEPAVQHEPAATANRADEIAEKLGPNVELSDRERERIDQLLDRGGNELEMERDQEVGRGLSRGSTD